MLSNHRTLSRYRKCCHLGHPILSVPPTLLCVPQARHDWRYDPLALELSALFLLSTLVDGL